MTWVGTLQIVDPHVTSTTFAYAYTEWPTNFPDEQPKNEHRIILHRGEVVLVVWESDRTALVRVLTSQGPAFFGMLNFYLPGWIDAEQVPWVIEQEDARWYFGA